MSISVSGDVVVSATLLWLGTPYRHQASQIDAGCDCLGLIRGVWRTIYGSEPAKLPPYARLNRDPAKASQLLQAAQTYLLEAEPGVLAGHLVLFQLRSGLPPRHCGIVIDETRFIHAQERLGVVMTNFDDNWRRRTHSFFAFPQRT